MANEFAAVLALGIERLSDDSLCALNNAVQMFCRVDPQNLAFQECVEMQLIEPDGSLWDIEAMRDACAFVVNNRFGREKQ